MRKTSIHNHKRTTASIMVAVLAMCLCGGCSKEEDSAVPAFKMDLVEADTDHEGKVSIIRLDNGTTYNVDQEISTETSDTTYRCMCTYAVDEHQKLHVYGLNHIFSPQPRPKDSFKSVAYDPVDLTSCWKSGGYLNLRIGLRTTDNGAHRFGFCEDSVVMQGGYQKVYFTLLHGRSEEDAESYTENVFMSIPLSQYACDSVCLRVQTYEGWREVVR